MADWNLKLNLTPDVFRLDAFSGHEEMSRLFNFTLDLSTGDANVSPKELVGQKVNFSYNSQQESDDKKTRHFHGIIKACSANSSDVGARIFRAEVVPWLWFLTRSANCRVFQKMTAPDIIKLIFADDKYSNIVHFKNKLSRTYCELEYCVQYRETDFNFVSRMMEKEGIFYYFEHTDASHALVLCDDAADYFDCAEKKVPFEYTYPPRVVGVTTWSHEFAFTSGKYAQTDYNFEKNPAKSRKKPSEWLFAESATIVDLPGIDKFELFDYPGEYPKVGGKDSGDGQTYTNIRMQEEEVAHDTIAASGLCASFGPGGKFELEKHPSGPENGKYVITAIDHAVADRHASVGGGSTAYHNRFTCIPEAVVFRPARTTPKPLVEGMLPAVVVGSPGKEIEVDKYGRIKVQFFWDRVGERMQDKKETSCWVRCIQGIAGKNWGAMHIPRVGQEVIVAFEEGDPDRPIITGSVYNDEQKPAYNPEDHPTRTYFKSNSSLGGEGFNELRIEDKKDKEQIFVHAERNLDVRVKNDSMERVFGNRHQIFGWEKDGKKGGDLNERVYQDKNLNVKRNQIEHIEGNYELMVGNGEADAGGEMNLFIEKKMVTTIGPDGSEVTIKGDSKNKVGGGYSLAVGGDIHEKASNVAIEAAQEIHIKGGTKVIIEAGAQLSLKGPGGFIDIGPSGVAISGTMVLINSGGAAGSGSGCKPASPKDAKEAAPKDPALADNDKTGQKSTPF